jgi:hypothetical protein
VRYCSASSPGPIRSWCTYAGTPPCGKPQREDTRRRHEATAINQSSSCINIIILLSDNAPLLWHKYLKEKLTKLGLKPVKKVPYLFTNERLIVFFYFDDIVVLVHPDHMDNHQQFERQL